MASGTLPNDSDVTFCITVIAATPEDKRGSKYIFRGCFYVFAAIYSSSVFSRLDDHRQHQTLCLNGNIFMIFKLQEKERQFLLLFHCPFDKHSLWVNDFLHNNSVNMNMELCA